MTQNLLSIFLLLVFFLQDLYCFFMNNRCLDSFINTFFYSVIVLFSYGILIATDSRIESICCV